MDYPQPVGAHWSSGFLHGMLSPMKTLRIFATRFPGARYGPGTATRARTTALSRSRAGRMIVARCLAAAGAALTLVASVISESASSTVAPSSENTPAQAATSRTENTPGAPPASALMVDARNTTHTTAAHPRPTGFRSPTGSEPVVTRPFDPPKHNWLPGHRGVDVELPAGSPVLAAGTGTVVYAGMLADRPVISIEHANGLRTTYEPVEPQVQRGETVSAGTVIGTLLAGHEDGGRFPGDVLHWGARRGKTYIDPLSLLYRREIRLYP
ncbi:M23 family metallopeptidase [Actinotignum sanguinis]|uniref:M23 family metallopeptidase n=2 Tax=Actinomycetaceae TaxID=2049 RepID=A0ABZ0RB90_9ACTO|nr:M23 family metallopeptidase [Actinotignum sanguinis]WPJ89376.1 M23 family metallopeptidase [Schaalia turicensis]MDE1641884.1 M23 family metallopeptidase [Actinotignum sanguinis]MDK7196961.1 M23 family metallopeptidase [Actinotignum sanguinis]MDK8352545.1 M23 family metallopeptidase [Actinotignum sanguinis]MDK8657028.1 M23 family metallopeptidase [Actinotignum sanguinis]